MRTGKICNNNVIYKHHSKISEDEQQCTSMDGINYSTK